MKHSLDEVKLLDLIINTAETVDSLAFIMDAAMPNHIHEDYTINVDMDTDRFVIKVRSLLNTLCSRIVDLTHLLSLFTVYEDREDAFYSLKCAGESVLRMNHALRIVEQQRGIN